MRAEGSSKPEQCPVSCHSGWRALAAVPVGPDAASGTALVPRSASSWQLRLDTHHVPTPPCPAFPTPSKEVDCLSPTRGRTQRSNDIQHREGGQVAQGHTARKK